MISHGNRLGRPLENEHLLYRDLDGGLHCDKSLLLTSGNYLSCVDLCVATCRSSAYLRRTITNTNTRAQTRTHACTPTYTHMHTHTHRHPHSGLSSLTHSARDSLNQM